VERNRDKANRGCRYHKQENANQQQHRYSAASKPGRRLRHRPFFTPSGLTPPGVGGLMFYPAKRGMSSCSSAAMWGNVVDGSLPKWHRLASESSRTSCFRTLDPGAAAVYPTIGTRQPLVASRPPTACAIRSGPTGQKVYHARQLIAPPAEGLHVRSGSEATICPSADHFRSTPISRHSESPSDQRRREETARAA
jgi:hypothetical protein